MDRKKLTIPVAEDESVSAVLTIPSNNKKNMKTGVITAHGAGNDMENELLVAFTDGLAAAGYLALRFNFPYKEKGLTVPDNQQKLEGTWAAVCRYFRENTDEKVNHVVAAGKSMGGRVASQMAAAGNLPVNGLIFLGYPLHAAGDHSKLRDAHLYQVSIPMLFFAGTRDSLCDLTLLQDAIKKLSVSWKLEIIEGGDHSFHIPASMGITEAEIQARIVKTTVHWIETTFAE
jgi:predicted alpha/beta-hydrolase family hydrolase